MNLEDFIKNLPENLQEKARACESVQELLALAKQEKIPVPDEALAAIAGGEDSEEVNCGKTIHCPKCGSTNVKFNLETNLFTCLQCGYQWVQ